MAAEVSNPFYVALDELRLQRVPEETTPAIDSDSPSAVDRSKTPPRASIVIPFSRDADFVNRGAALCRIQEACSVPGSRTALVGLGGVGKSQLAIEHAYRTHEQFPDTWVFWVHASNASRFQQSFYDIADCVNIPGRHDPLSDVYKLVHNWLRDSKERWLIVLGNVDDARFLVDVQAVDSKPGTRPLREYLPHCAHGSFLITSRSKDAALKLVAQREIIPVEAMDESQAMELFEKKFGAFEEDDANHASELVTALEYMPLAIAQAAAYISQRRPRSSVQQYLADFQRSERKRTNLLNHDETELRRDWQARNSIIITWQISFDLIRQVRPSAAELLSLMCLFDRQGIPESLLRHRGEGEGDTDATDSSSEGGDDDNDDTDDDDASQSSSSDDEFEEDIVMLRNYSFISVETSGTTFEMHRLVQLAMREWLKSQGQLEKYKKRLISTLEEHFPVPDYKNWTTCKPLFPHVQSAAALRPADENNLDDWALVLWKGAFYGMNVGNGAVSDKMMLQALKASKRGSGTSDVSDVCMLYAADSYCKQGQWDAAEEVLTELLRTSRGKDSEDFLLKVESSLAEVYRDSGRLHEAEELMRKIWQARTEVSGEEHASTIHAMSDLGHTYYLQSRYDAAEEIEHAVLEISRKRLGEEHPATIVYKNNLALTYDCQGRLSEAETLYLQVIEVKRKLYGMDNPETAVSLGNLANVYLKQGRKSEAETVLLQALEVFKKTLGMDHPTTLLFLRNRAVDLDAQERYTEAISIFEDIIPRQERVLGPRHHQTLLSIDTLSSTRSDLSKSLLPPDT